MAAIGTVTTLIMISMLLTVFLMTGASEYATSNLKPGWIEMISSWLMVIALTTFLFKRIAKQLQKKL
jgi:hypothetical protein